MYDSDGMLTNAAYDAVEHRARRLGFSLDRCPTCRLNPNHPWTYPVSAEGDHQMPEDHDCGEQMHLLTRYVAANVPFKLWTFDWSRATRTPLTKGVDDYLADMGGNFRLGLGLVMVSPRYGNGKTTAAVEIIKQAIKNKRSPRRPRTAYIAKFGEVVRAFEREDAAEFEEMLRTVDVLMIDEVQTASSPAQANLFLRFADLIDDRYECLLPTLLTGNLTEEQLATAYPQVHSRLQECALFLTVPDVDLRPEHGLANRTQARDRSLRL